MKIHARHVRHRSFKGVHHSHHFKRWLNQQATRLKQTASYVFNELLKRRKMTAAQVEAIATPAEGGS